ncbi:MAG: hypothetical protein QM763_17150 [Agriterribacter sp.]
MRNYIRYAQLLALINILFVTLAFSQTNRNTETKSAHIYSANDSTSTVSQAFKAQGISIPNGKLPLTSGSWFMPLPPDFKKALQKLSMDIEFNFEKHNDIYIVKISLIKTKKVIFSGKFRKTSDGKSYRYAGKTGSLNNKVVSNYLEKQSLENTTELVTAMYTDKNFGLIENSSILK